MSASTTPTFWPEAASAAARFTVTDDLPTPPLPLATAYTRVSEDGWANGICGSGRPPRSCVCSARRCSSLITSSWTRTEDTPGSLPTAPVTSRVILSRSGHPATVRYTSTSTAPSAATSMFLTMPSSVIGRLISGSCTPSSAWVTCSALGGIVREEVMAPWYAAAVPVIQGRPPYPPPRNGGGRDREYGRGLRGATGYPLTTSPVVGSRMTGRKFGLVKKSSRPPGAVRRPETAS